MKSYRREMKKHNTIKSFQYNDNFKKWFWFVNETLVSAFVGALIAFVFGSHYWAALAAFGILMVFLIILSIFFILLENKVSVLSIMNQGLKDGKFEDVIKFGSAMRTTLFTANKNDEIVMLGNKIDEAASKIESDHYNRLKGDYPVTIDGKQNSITQIRIGLKIDDLGWSMHLCKKNDEAVDNIINGIRRARNEASRLSKIYGNDKGKVIIPFVKLILRGYRHLAGIYYEDIKEHWRAEFYEKVTKLIMSNYKIIIQGEVSESWISKQFETTTENESFYYLPYERKIEYIRKNIFDLYYERKAEISSNKDLGTIDIYSYLNISQGNLMSETEIEDDIKLFNMLPIENQNEFIKEQCYAWSRNIVKKVQNGIFKQGEYKFISDYELTCKVAEARAFSQGYYYGTNDITTNDDFDNVINKNILGKSELRYLSLMNEIELVNLFQPSSLLSQKRENNRNSGRNVKIEKLIEHLKKTREILRDKRADLFVRTSIHLITAYYYEYNLNYRYLTNNVIDKSLESRKKRLASYKKTIKDLYKEIRSYEHKANNDLEDRYHSIMEDLRIAEKRLKIKYIKTLKNTDDIFINKFKQVNDKEYAQHIKLNNIKAAIHKFRDNEIQIVKTKWGMK